MPLDIDALLERPEGERTGTFLSMNFGSAFWAMRTGGPGAVDPTAFVSGSDKSNFHAAGVSTLEPAKTYWGAKGEYGEYLFLKPSGLKPKDQYLIHLVGISHAVDDEAPTDATHRAFVELEKKRFSEAYVKLSKGSNPTLRRIDKPKPNPEPSPSLTLEVWTGAAYETKSSEEMEAFVLAKDSQRGKSNVKRCVSMMGRGGKHTIAYPKVLTKNVLHASKGRRGDSGTCSIFYVELTNKVRLVGIGHHTGNASYAVSWCEQHEGHPVLPSSIVLS